MSLGNSPSYCHCVLFFVDEMIYAVLCINSQPLSQVI